MTSGQAEDPSHTCKEDSLPRAIKSYLDRFPGALSTLPWTCLTCGAHNDTNRGTCSSSGCQDTREHALDNLLVMMEPELLMMQETGWKSPELMNVGFVIELLLSPHNRLNQGLVKEAYNTPVEPDNLCSCGSALELLGSLGDSSLQYVTNMDTFAALLSPPSSTHPAQHSVSTSHSNPPSVTTTSSNPSPAITHPSNPPHITGSTPNPPQFTKPSCIPPPSTTSPSSTTPSTTSPSNPTQTVTVVSLDF